MPYTVSLIHNGLPGDIDFRSSKVLPEDIQDLLPDSLCFLEFTLSQQTIKKAISLNSDFSHIYILCPNPASSVATTPKYADFFGTQPLHESDTESSASEERTTADTTSSPAKRKRGDATDDTINEVGVGKKLKVL